MSVINHNAIIFQLLFPLTYWHFEYCYNKPHNRYIQVPAMETNTGQSLIADNQVSEHFQNLKVLEIECFSPG